MHMDIIIKVSYDFCDCAYFSNAIECRIDKKIKRVKTVPTV